MTKIIFRHEKEGEQREIKSLIKKVFPKSQDSRAVSILRKNVLWKWDYCFVAEVNGEIVGSVRFFTVTLPSGKECVMLGPLGVKGKYRGKGVGQTLVENSLHALAGREDGVLIIGSSDYYDIYGFETEVVKKLRVIGETKPFELMGLEFEDGFFTNEKGLVVARKS